MLEVKDPVIKLFGKTISLPPNEAALDHHHHHEQSSCSTSIDNKSTSGGELTRSRLENDPINPTEEEPIEPATPSGDSETLKTRGSDTETLSPKVTEKEEQSEISASKEKTLKKPDKIIPCPRCNSMDTKFCYYNNYNVNQPRYFCKNCQRYWTAGGTMRNVPVGSGRRKNKNSCASNYQHIMVSEALQAAQADVANGIHMYPLKADGIVLAFGSERLLCESESSAISLAQRGQNCVPNGFHGAEPRIPVSYGAMEIGRDHLNSSSSTSLNSMKTGGHAGPQESILKNYQSFAPRVPCYLGAPLPSLWNSAHLSSPAVPHSFNPSGFPVTSYPTTPYWGCTVASPWNGPWLSPSPSSPNHSALSTSPTSVTLGKHSRDGSMIKSSNLGNEELVEEKDAGQSVLLPKILRIDDPDEAPKSSIWSTLGIKNEKKDSVSGANLCKAFRPKVDDRNRVADTFLILQANPAAFSRSTNFHEST